MSPHQGPLPALLFASGDGCLSLLLAGLPMHFLISDWILPFRQRAPTDTDGAHYPGVHRVSRSYVGTHPSLTANAKRRRRVPASPDLPHAPSTTCTCTERQERTNCVKSPPNSSLMPPPPGTPQPWPCEFPSQWGPPNQLTNLPTRVPLPGPPALAPMYPFARLKESHVLTGPQLRTGT